MSARISEPSLYPSIRNVFKEVGASVVQELRKATQPDFVVDWLGDRWLVSIKIGDVSKPKFVKDVFIQLYDELRDFREHLRGSDRALLLIYPESIRKVRPEEAEIERAVRSVDVYAISLRPQMELRAPLPKVLREIEEVVRKKVPVSLSLKTVTSLLRAHLEDLMSEIEVEEKPIRDLLDSELFFWLSPSEVKEKIREEKGRKAVLRDVLSFLGAYIFLSQALFLRFYYEKAPLSFEGIDPRDVGRSAARKLFNSLKDVNYRPIFEVDVLDYVHEKFIKETFRLLFALQVDNVRYEVPGRLFHELMPSRVRKLLAAFYTRPIAAYLLAQLTIDDPNATVFDPACGSGTILTMAYRRKLELWKERGLEEKLGSPHRKFCEEQIFGCDIMPFAVHLTNANLIAMDPLTTIDHTQIAQEDSLKLAPCTKIVPGLRTLMDYMDYVEKKELDVRVNVYKRSGELTEIHLRPVDVILMNPPFTKVERGIKKYMEAEKFEGLVGGEVGLWGHFIALADAFLKEGGVLGAVIPINLLRGRESKKVREIVFKHWLPLYIIKPTRNYGFTEYAEYRDVLLIAKKVAKKPRNHKVKFCVVKKDLNELSEEEVSRIAESIKSSERLRSELLDVDSYPLEEVYKRFDNMMYFIAGPSLDGLEALRHIIREAERLFKAFPEGYFKEGYRLEKGYSKFMFITRPGRGRLKEAFLRLESEDTNIIATTPAGVQKFKFSKEHFLPALRTPVGLTKMDVTNLCDYIAKEPYEDMDKVMKLAGLDKEELRVDYWETYVEREFRRASTYVALVCRINPYSPDQSLIAFSSQRPLIASDLFNVVDEGSEGVRKALTVLFNSIFLLAYTFCHKEETTGRYIHVRKHELYEMKLFPSRDQVERLVKVYEKYKDKEFPPLREQLDKYYDLRYEDFWNRQRRQETLIKPPPKIEPHELRLEFDLDVVRSVGSSLTREDILKAYEAIVWDMIITRGLRRD
jgi:type I restriction-modification system DNA methylase subunit